MEAYVFANYGLTIFDTSRDTITLNSAGQPIDQIKNLLTITTANGFPSDGAPPPRTTPQMDTPIQVADLIYFVSYQSVRTPQYSNMTLNFACISGRVYRKIINYETKAGKALYNLAIRLIYSDSEGNFALAGEGIFHFTYYLLVM